MSILVIGASNSKNSINKALATYAAELTNKQFEVLDLNYFEMPIYGIDKEESAGIPDLAKQFKQTVKDADAVIISFAEHNGSYSVAFKNIMDWTSRLGGKLWEEKKYLLLATSPGARGGASVLGTAVASFPHMGANVVGSLSIPSFYENFKNGKLVDSNLNNKLKDMATKLL